MWVTRLQKAESQTNNLVTLIFACVIWQDKPHQDLGKSNFGKKSWKEIKSGVLRKKSYMYVHCFFKFLAHVNPHINPLTFKTENTKTLTYNFSFLIV